MRERVCLVVVMAIPACGLGDMDSAITVPSEVSDAGIAEPADSAIDPAIVSPPDLAVPTNDTATVVPSPDLADTADAASTPRLCEWQGFAPATSYPANGNSVFLRAGDLNNDGRLDLVSTSPYEGLFLILMGAEGGAFAPAQQYRRDNWVSGIAIADFDEDGDADIALAASSTQLGPVNGIDIVLNGGDGVPTGYLLWSTPEPWDGVAAGDLDGDGHVDIAVTNTGLQAKLGILRNRGRGSFEDTARYAAGSNASDLALADFNADGRLDVVATSAKTAFVSVWINKGDGSFGEQAKVSIGDGHYFLAVADFDRDGYPDIAAPNQTEDVVSVLHNKGDATFEAPSRFAVGKGANRIATADVDDDGYPDILVANAASQTIGLLRNRGDGAFAVQASYATSSFPLTLTTGDFDQDGLPDVAAVCASGTIDVLLSQCL